MSGNTDGGATKQAPAVSERALFGLALLAGIVMLVLSAVVNAHLLALFSPDRALERATIGRIHSAQLRFLGAGALIVGLAVLCRHCGVFRRLAERHALTNVVLMLSALTAFVFVANNILSTNCPTGELTTVFVRDEALGWKLRAGADGRYSGARYVVNSKGLRSPHSEYRKPAGTKRILQLGDSATIGNGLPYEDTCAHILESAFKDRLEEGSVEVINAACDGYSPWQELAFLQTEGLKYSPDVVTVGFVLNDVTEMFSLKRFGGHGIGGQLQDSREQHGVSNFVLNRILRRTPLYQFLSRVFLKVKLGRDPQAAAMKLDRLRAEDVVFKHNADVVKYAWRASLKDLSSIKQVCSDNGIQLLVLFIPFEFQLSLPDSMSHPQQVLRDFCEHNAVPYLDLTPILVDDMKTHGRRPSWCFGDAVHPSSEGNRLIAMTLLDYIQANDLFGKAD